MTYKIVENDASNTASSCHVKTENLASHLIAIINSKEINGAAENRSMSKFKRYYMQKKWKGILDLLAELFASVKTLAALAVLTDRITASCFSEN